ncbi:PIR protein [Plasmodium vivax]|uniref:VIR protein n=1 Tax=Plasmodium vivax TaxID=5855 RepID=A0A565A432_PLAVI|nr:PIR protein [Plasmodium vivax]
MLYPNLHYYENESDAHNSGNHNVLKSLPLYKYYEELHNAIDTYNDQKLDVDCDYCTSNQESKSDEGSKLIKLCRGICGIIQDFDNFKKNCKQIPDEKLCPYINYWLLDYALTISNVNTHIDRFYSALAIISISKRNLWKKCSFKKYTLKKSIFDKKKILYEFTEIYDHIKEEFSHENNSNVKTYCKHIKENFRYFNSINEECINQNSCDYYDEYKKFKEKFNNPEVLNLIYEKCDYTKTPCAQGSNAEDDVPCLREKGNSFLYQIFGNDAENIINILLKVTTISAPILVLFVILFKFTPLGKNLNKIKQERKKSGHKKKEENIQDYMKNYAAHLDSEMKNRIHLGYHAT